MTPIPAIGEKAPDFDLPVVGGDYPEGARLTLDRLRGSRVVLYFYPKDDTPGCTTQACGLRDAWGELATAARIFGISVDPPRRHRRFLEKYGLPFPLLSDEERTMVTDYGVWVEKSLYGRTYFGTERTTFVLDGDGVVRQVLRRVKPADHAAQLREILG